MTTTNVRTDKHLIAVLIGLCFLGPLLTTTDFARAQASGNPYLERPPQNDGAGGGSGGGSGLGGGGFGGLLGGGSHNLRPSAVELPAAATILTSTLNKEQNYCLGCLFSHPADTIFPDLKGHFARDAVQMLAETTSHGEVIVRGFAVKTDLANEFRPEQSITRAEFLKMGLLTTCIEIKNWDDDNPQKRLFKDLPTDSDLWYKNIVYTASELGLVDGYADGNFHGDKPVTRAEAAKIVVNLNQSVAGSQSNADNATFFSDVSGDEWFSDYVSRGHQLGLIYGSKNNAGKDIFRPKSNLSRGETAVMLARMLKQKEFVTFHDPDAHNYIYLRTEQIFDGNQAKSQSGRLNNPDLQSNLLGTLLTIPWTNTLMAGLGLVLTLLLLRSGNKKRCAPKPTERIDN